MFNSKKIASSVIYSGFILWSGFAMAGHDEPAHSKKNAHCSNSIAGVYVGAIPGATTFIMRNIPLGNDNSKLATSIDTSGQADPTARGLFANAVGMTSPHGVFIRKKENGAYVYDGQFVRYRYDAAGAVVATEIQFAKVDLIECDSAQVTFVGDWYFYGYVNAGVEPLPEPAIVVDPSRFAPFIINKFGE